MRTKEIRIVLLISMCMLHHENTFTWGFFAHKKINRLAVFTLPPPMFGFYKQHIEFITEHAVDADKRRYVLKEEGARHYFDADHYECSLPFDTIPKFWKDAVEKYGEDSLLEHGIVPWHISFMVFRLTEAFKSGNRESILRLSSDLGHYVADCHVPLHTTRNYNGQLSGQHGIHGLWESRLPELFSLDYDFFTGRAVYISDVQNTVWKIVESSHKAVDSVLVFEKQLTQSFDQDKKYSFEQRGNSMSRVYSREFSMQYHRLLSGMVERRMRESVSLIGSLWYTSWVNAGQPALDFKKAHDSDTLSNPGNLLFPETELKMIGREEE